MKHLIDGCKLATTQVDRRENYMVHSDLMRNALCWKSHTVISLNPEQPVKCYVLPVIVLRS